MAGDPRFLQARLGMASPGLAAPAAGAQGDDGEKRAFGMLDAILHPLWRRKQARVDAMALLRADPACERGA